MSCKVLKPLLAAVLLLQFPARAVLFEPLAIDALAQQAEAVVEGKVLSKTAMRDESGRIYTQVEIEVTDLWKGSISGSPLAVVHGGGILGEHRSSVSGQVEYELGENVVAFIVRNHRGEAVTLGLAQGKFHVWTDGTTGVRYAVNSFHGVTQTAAGRVGLLNHKPGLRNGGLLSVSELRKLVREAAR
jgi:hypothetical protein